MRKVYFETIVLNLDLGLPDVDISFAIFSEEALIASLSAILGTLLELREAGWAV